MTPAIHLGPALVSAVLAVIALVCIIAGLLVHQHAQDTTQTIAEQHDALEDQP